VCENVKVYLMRLLYKEFPFKVTEYKKNQSR